MKLTAERVAHPDKYTDPIQPVPELEDPRLYHYAIFSDNVLAASVVVNSAVRNSKDPTRHVFHVVTDRMNLGAMQVCKNFMHIPVITLNAMFTPQKGDISDILGVGVK